MRRLPMISFAIVMLSLASAAHGAHALKVASFNILKGGVEGGQPLALTRDVIRACGADVVGIQESDGSAQALADLLGWHCRVFSFDRGTEMGNTDNAILSRLPITQTLRGGVRIQISPGKEAYVFNAHLRAYPYQPYDIRDGKHANEEQAVATAAAARREQMEQLLAEMKPYLSAGRAVFLTGDFNEPSHLDWTDDAAKARLRSFKVAWPASTLAAEAGLRDSYRQLHRDEVKQPGHTWTCRPEPNEVHDRIDFVYFAGNGVTALKSQVVGESANAADIVVSNYPSDHRAVVSIFTIPDASLAPLRKGVNLVSNGGAEANPGAARGDDRILTDWETVDRNAAATAQLFNKDGYAGSFAASGCNYFYGGNITSSAAESHSITQTIDVADLAGEIDAAKLRFQASGYFGGYSDQNDTAAMSGEFLDAAGHALASFTIGNVTAADRENDTLLLPRDASGQLPRSTRAIRVNLIFNKTAEGTSNHAAADNLSLVLRGE